MESVQVVLAVFTALMASSGFWAYLKSKRSNKDAYTKLLMGLAYDRIIVRGMRHVEKGYMYRDEYEDFRRYLIEPYKALGGNGVVDRILVDIQQLPIHNHHHKSIHIKTHQGETIYESTTKSGTDSSSDDSE